MDYLFNAMALGAISTVLAVCSAPISIAFLIMFSCNCHIDNMQKYARQ